MAENCRYSSDRDETLIAYLYDDIDADARAAFDAHLSGCAPCRDELRALGGVRQQLARWAPPEPSLTSVSRQSSAVGQQSSVVSPSRQSSWREIPAWAQVAAALVFLGVGAGLANLDVRYDRNGLTVRTGWSNTAPIADNAQPPGSAAANAGAASRADLAALEERLRGELRAASGTVRTATVADAAPSRASSDADLLRRVHALIDETEKRQQRELALRIGEVLRDVNGQRQADLVRIDRSLGLVQNNLGVEVLKQRESLNYLIRANQVK